MNATERMQILVLSCCVGLLLAAGGCSADGDESPQADVGTSDASAADTPTDDTSERETDDSSTTGDTDDSPDGSAPSADEHVIHSFPSYNLGPGEEVIPCVQWTLNNDKPLYVNSVTLANGGGYHHSNWFVVPENYAAGSDGYFNCEDRNFAEVSAATRGTVLFAQSTQAQSETQQFQEGAVIKIPANHKIVANVHMLNTTTRELDTFSRMTLGLTHPRNVDTVLTPFRLTYRDLEIPPKSESRFTGECNMAEPHRSKTGSEFDIDLHYVLPHYHGLGNYFGLEIMGGPRDGEQLFELTGFNAEANGQTFEQPIDLSGSKGLRFTCGYDNPRDEEVGWGYGDQEMCVMLGFADSDVLFEAGVRNGNEVVDEEDGIVKNEGPCRVLPIEPASAQGPPTEEEKQGELYVPESEDADDLDPVPECEEYSGEAEPLRDPTLSNLERDVFSVGCSYSACHGADAPAADLSLVGDDLHDGLMNHELQTPTDLPLVDPGNPEGSWLYRVTSRCEPQSNAGPVSHMPKNSPTLLEPKMLAMIREWIRRGAQDN